MRGRRRLMALGLSLSSSALLALSSEPFAFAPVAWVALTPLFVAILREPKWRWSALYGFVCGAAYFAFHLSWIFLFGWMAWVGLVLVMSAFSAAAGWAAGVVRRLPLAPALVAGAWTGAELLRDRIPWGGFSWGTLGTSQAAMPGVRWLAGTVGAFGLTFLTAFVAAVVADRVVAGGMPWGSIGLVGAVLVALVAVDAAMFAGAGQGRPFEVAVVQGNVPRPYDELRQRERVLEGHMRLTRTLLDDPARPDLVVWAEDAVRSDVLPDADAQIAALAAELGTPMLVGRSETDFVREGFLNLVDHIDEAGTTVDSYSKRHPVPFGEYVPVSFLRRFVTTLDQVPYDMLRGSEPTVFDVSGTKVAAPICFESVFPRDVRVFARKGSEVVVYTTNDSSFERSFASEQHLAHARVRALEMRQWGVQAALSGISAVIGPDGSVTGRTRLFEPDVVRAELRARPAASLYSRTGDVFAAAWAAAAAAAVALALAVRAPRRRRSESQPDEPVTGLSPTLR